MDRISSSANTTSVVSEDAQKHVLDPNREKRAQIAMACDTCRKQKIKCRRQGRQTCLHCSAQKIECVVSRTRKRRVVSRTKKEEYLSAVTDCVQQMESLLARAGFGLDKASSPSDKTQAMDNSTPPPPQITYDQSPLASEPVNEFREASNSILLQEFPSRSIDVTESPMPDPLPNVELSLTPRADILGDTSSYSFFSPRGLAWVSTRIGHNSLQQILARLVCFDVSFNTEIWRPLPDHMRQPLPSREDALPIVNIFFGAFNQVFHLFSRSKFDVCFEQHYSNPLNLSTSWYAVYNVVLAIGGMNDNNTVTVSRHQREGSVYWKYYLNAASCFLDLNFKEPDLLAIQAMTALAIVMQSTPNPRSSFVLVATAARLAHDFGLHNRPESCGVSNPDVNERSCVFWTIYTVEKGISLRFGRSSTFNNQYIGVDLPEDNLENFLHLSPGTIGGGLIINMPRTMAKLAILEGQIYRQLYSEEAKNISEHEILSRMRELDSKLQHWKEEIPVEIRPGMDYSVEFHAHFAITTLHLRYYNCLATIHRSWSMISLTDSDESSKRIVDSRHLASWALMLSAARSTIHTMKSINPDSDTFLWIVLYYPISASILLFTNIISNPRDPRNRSDCKLLDMVVDVLARPVEFLDEKEGSSDAMGVFETMRSLASIARDTISKVHQPSAEAAGPRLPNNKNKNGAGTDAHIRLDTDYQMDSGEMGMYNGLSFPEGNELSLGYLRDDVIPNQDSLGTHLDLSRPREVYYEPQRLPGFNLGFQEAPGSTGHQSPNGLNAWEMPMPMTFEWDLADIMQHGNIRWGSSGGDGGGGPSSGSARQP